jgi:hypothetical protein
MSLNLDPAQLALWPVNYNGDKREFPHFWRLVMQIALAFNFEPILRLPKEEAIQLMAMTATSPTDSPNTQKHPTFEEIERARKWYKSASPIVAMWLARSVPQAYTNQLLSAPMGDAFATWSIISKKAHPNTKRAARQQRRHFYSLHMQRGVSYEDLVSEILISSALLVTSNSPVSDDEKLAVLYDGVPASFDMSKTILEHNEHTTFDQAVETFTAVSEDIAREKARKARRNNNPDQLQTPSPTGRKKRYKHLDKFCPFCFAVTHKKFPHIEDSCRRKHEQPTTPPANFVAEPVFPKNLNPGCSSSSQQQHPSSSQQQHPSSSFPSKQQHPSSASSSRAQPPSSCSSSPLASKRPFNFSEAVSIILLLALLMSRLASDDAVIVSTAMSTKSWSVLN